MRSHTTMHLDFRRRWAALVLCVAFLGCSEQAGPVAPAYSPSLARGGTSGSNLDASSVVVTTLTRNELLAADYEASVLVTPDSGGYLQIPEAGLIVYAPPGPRWSRASRLPRALAGGSVAYEFGPHGTVFNVPVYVWQDLKATTWRQIYDRTKKMEVGYFKNRNQIDELAGTASVDEIIPLSSQTNRNNALFTVNHFSGYILATGRQSQY
jgi:hypothetical protein